MCVVGIYYKSDVDNYKMRLKVKLATNELSYDELGLE